MSGEYHMTMDPSEKDALLYVPGAGLTLMEQMGMSDKTQRFNNTDGTHLGSAIRRPAGEHERVQRASSSSPSCRSRPRSSSRTWKRRSLRASATTFCP